MMQYYQELTLLPDSEIPLPALWSKVYETVHIALAEDGSGEIGISFPAYGDVAFPLGDKMRIIALSAETLEQLQLKKKLNRLQDYLHMKSVNPVPEKKVHSYASYSRWHKENTKEQKVRRYLKRHSDVTEKEARDLFPGDQYGKEPPFVQMKSCSNHHRYQLYIKRTEKQEEVNGLYTTFGLSMDATVPEW